MLYTELVEVFAINTMAPFLLNKRVIPLLEQVRMTNSETINMDVILESVEST